MLHSEEYCMTSQTHHLCFWFSWFKLNLSFCVLYIKCSSVVLLRVKAHSFWMLILLLLLLWIHKRRIIYIIYTYGEWNFNNLWFENDLLNDKKWNKIKNCFSFDWRSKVNINRETSSSIRYIKKYIHRETSLSIRYVMSVSIKAMIHVRLFAGLKEDMILSSKTSSISWEEPEATPYLYIQICIISYNVSICIILRIFFTIYVYIRNFFLKRCHI